MYPGMHSCGRLCREDLWTTRFGLQGAFVESLRRVGYLDVHSCYRLVVKVFSQKGHDFLAVSCVDNKFRLVGMLFHRSRDKTNL